MSYELSLILLYQFVWVISILVILLPNIIIMGMFICYCTFLCDPQATRVLKALHGL